MSRTLKASGKTESIKEKNEDEEMFQKWEYLLLFHRTQDQFPETRKGFITTG